MDANWNGSKYKVLRADAILQKNGKRQWLVWLGIRRIWPLSWWDFRPWENFPRRQYPIKTFFGQGYAWSEMKNGRAYAVGNLSPVLNAIISEEALKLIPNERITNEDALG